MKINIIKERRFSLYDHKERFPHQDFPVWGRLIKGTDISPYCDLYGGLTINMAINLRSHFTLFTGDDIYDPKANNSVPYLGKKEFVYAFMEEFGINDMHLSKFNSSFDGILEAGLGSSASSAVAIIGAINKLKNLGMSLDEIAEKAWEIEVNKLGLFGGKQDQNASVFGGVNIMEFKKGGGVNVTPLAKGFIEPLLPSLVLFYTGTNRKSAKIQEGFKTLNEDQIWALDNIKRLAVKAIDPIAKGDYIQVGALLDEAWEYKKLSNKGVTNKRIDDIYGSALVNGAYGGKCLGAGSGGYMLFIVDPKEKEKFIKNMMLMDCEWWDFSPCFQGLETRILP